MGNTQHVLAIDLKRPEPKVYQRRVKMPNQPVYVYTRVPKNRRSLCHNDTSSSGRQSISAKSTPHPMTIKMGQKPECIVCYQNEDDTNESTDCCEGANYPLLTPQIKNSPNRRTNSHTIIPKKTESQLSRYNRNSVNSRPHYN